MRSFRFAIAIILAPSFAAAQSTTADGVHAILNGDYSTAARILKPLAENTPRPDPIAQFFLAALYDSGHGVPRNLARASSLYLSAADKNHPLQHQARDIAQMIEEPYAGAHGGVRFCFPADAHPWAMTPPASFSLGPGHTIRIDVDGTTVTFNGVEHHTAPYRAGVPADPLRACAMYRRKRCGAPSEERCRFRSSRPEFRAVQHSCMAW